MTRKQGSFNMQSNVEPRVAAPFDARLVVPAKSDLTDASNFPYPYIGMIVSVQAEGIAYILTDADTTTLDNWKPIGEGTAITVDDVMSETSENPVQNKVITAALADKAGKTELDNYYTKIEADTLLDGKQDELTAGENISIVQDPYTGTTVISATGGGGEEGKTYTMDWDKDTHELTLTDGTTPQKLELVGLAGQIDTMPTATADDEGKIVQYTGETNSSFTNGYFYECVEVLPYTDPKTYKWEAKSVQAGGSSGGNANFTLDTTNNFATIQSQTQGLSFQLDDANGVTITASDPGTYINTKILATQDYVDSHSGGAFVLDTANPCSYNELQSTINTPSVILIKHEGAVYPFVEKWESDEGAKRYVNIASLQRQAVDKGAMYFFFEATIGDFDSPMAYSSNFAQPTGKPYTDNIAGNLTDLTTTAKTNVVSAINELKSSVDALGEPFRVKQWGASNLNVTIVPCTSDVDNTSLAKMTYTITGQEATDYQIVGMIAYEVFDAASGGNRINCWPVCQFTGQGQTELSIRWMCGGSSNKVAKRINAWVLLKHR